MQHRTNGFIIVDKPSHMTSANVVARLKKAIGAKKVGHTGTLDPFATGVLVCCVNKASRLSRFFLTGDKKYEATLYLGVETDTQDSTGSVIATCAKTAVSEKKIRAAFKQFEGAIEQFPPVYSALKHHGIPLYKLARRGNPIQKPARRVFISYLKIFEIKLPEIRFEISCSAGTYIRTLCSDIGAALGCGGHLKELRRIESGGFTIKDALTLPELEKLALAGKISERMIRMADALRGLPAHIADAALTEKISKGIPLTSKDFSQGRSDTPRGFFKVVDRSNHLLAVLTCDKDGNAFKYCGVFH